MTDTDEIEDIGVIAHVPPSQRKDDDKGKDSNALEGGDDVESAEAWFDDPEGAK